MEKKSLKTYQDLIDKLVSISVNTYNSSEAHPHYLRFQADESLIYYNGSNDVFTYGDTLKKLYSANKEVVETITQNDFRDHLNDLIVTLKKEERKCSRQDIEELYQKLLESNIQNYEVLYELFGVTMHEPIELGVFKVYNYNISGKFFLEHPFLQTREYLFENRKTDTFLGIKVQARDALKAIELADEMVGVFENVISYMIGDLKHKYSVGVVNFRQIRHSSTIALSQDTAGGGSNSRANHLESIDIENPFFRDPERGFDKIWSLIGKKDKNEIERRLLQAIQWIGKGVNDNDKSKALVQFVFAVEGMLQYHDGSIINASIVSHLSDSLAFIIEDELEKRKRIYNQFKDIYTARSAVVHGGNKNINFEYLKSVLYLVKRMIFTILTKTPFREMNNMKELQGYITDQKFK